VLVLWLVVVGGFVRPGCCGLPGGTRCGDNDVPPGPSRGEPERPSERPPEGQPERPPRALGLVGVLVYRFP